jgi:hypothetical protein
VRVSVKAYRDAIRDRFARVKKRAKKEGCCDSGKRAD